MNLVLVLFVAALAQLLVAPPDLVPSPHSLWSAGSAPLTTRLKMDDSAALPASGGRCGTTFDTIAFEGGGTRGIIYGGASIALEEAGLLQSVCNFAGTSAGSSSAALLAVGYTACELQKELLNQNFLRLVMDKETADATTVLTALGFDTGLDFDVLCRNAASHCKGWFGPLSFLWRKWIQPSLTAVKAFNRAKIQLENRKGLILGRTFARDVDRLLAKKLCALELNIPLDNITFEDLKKGHGIDTDGSSGINMSEFDSFVEGRSEQRFRWTELERKLSESTAAACVRQQIRDTSSDPALQQLDPLEFVSALQNCLQGWNSTDGAPLVDGSMWREGLSSFENNVLHLMTWSCQADNSAEIRGPGRCARFRCFSLGRLPDVTRSAQCPRGRRLAISGYDISNGSLQYLRPDTTPNMPIATAVRISSSIPLVVSPSAHLESQP
eukprot:SAG31_NODE_126_length_23665_cov_6.178987_14_plen_440_part_00